MTIIIVENKYLSIKIESLSENAFAWFLWDCRMQQFLCCIFIDSSLEHKILARVFYKDVSVNI